MTSVETIKEIAEATADAARTNLTKYGDLIPVLMLVRDDEVTDIVGIPDIPDLKAKRAAYRQIAILLQLKTPDAVIMINDAYMKCETDKKAIDAYKDGCLSVDPEAVECILIAFKGPLVETHILTLPYARNEVGDIVFKEPLRWVTGAEMNLLPDWWQP